MILAIDPGHHAAASVLISGHVLTDWRAYRSIGRSGDVLLSSPDGEWRSERRAGARWLATLTRSCVPDRILVEQTPALLRHAAHGGQGVQSLVTQSEAAGAIVQELPHAERVHPEVWRPEVLRVAWTDPGAGRAAMAAWGWGKVRRVGPDAGWRGTVACDAPPEWARPHVADAGCIGVWASR